MFKSILVRYAVELVFDILVMQAEKMAAETDNSLDDDFVLLLKSNKTKLVRNTKSEC